MQKRYLQAGKILGTHGIAGEMRVQSWCDSNEILASLKRLYLDTNGTMAKVLSARVHKNCVLLKLEGINTVQEAAAMRGSILYLDRNDVKLPEGVYFVQDLIGSRVLDADSGKEYGVLSDISFTPANDVYHITSKEGKEYLLPCIKETVINTDIENSRIFIRPIKGIFDNED